MSDRARRSAGSWPGGSSRWCSRARSARARETCRLAGFASAAQPSDDLLEWDYGIYEGRTTAEVRAEQPGWSIWTTPMPKGETVEQVGERTRRVIDAGGRGRW